MKAYKFFIAFGDGSYRNPWGNDVVDVTEKVTSIDDLYCCSSLSYIFYWMNYWCHKTISGYDYHAHDCWIEICEINTDDDIRDICDPSNPAPESIIHSYTVTRSLAIYDIDGKLLAYNK